MPRLSSALLVASQPSSGRSSCQSYRITRSNAPMKKSLDVIDSGCVLAHSSIQAQSELYHQAPVVDLPQHTTRSQRWLLRSSLERLDVEQSLPKSLLSPMCGVLSME